MDVPTSEKRLNTISTRQLLARASEFEARLRTLEHNQAVMQAKLDEFLYNWRMSIAAAYAVQKRGESLDGQTG